MFHELMHLDIVTDIPSNPPQIKDVTITVELLHNGEIGHFDLVAYEPARCKLLARFQPNPGH